MRIDLHVHTSASDGAYSPDALIALAVKCRLQVLAITDHDTVDGLLPAQGEAAKRGAPLIIPAIELSAEDEQRSVHILGYYIQPEQPSFRETLTQFRAERWERGQKIVAKLASLGVPILWERVVALAGSAAVGRPHIARAMVEAGHVFSVREAFDRYLGDRGAAFAARDTLSPEGAIELIHSAGGAAVLAHPGVLHDYRAMVERLVPSGLDGIEVVHPVNSAALRLDLRGLARVHNLVMTGGSDFHGSSGGRVTLGSETPPEGCVPALRERARRYQ